MNLHKSKTLKSIRFRILVVTMTALFITLLWLLIENDGGSPFLFLAIGAIVLILVYLKVKACLQLLEKNAQS